MDLTATQSDANVGDMIGEARKSQPASAKMSQAQRPALSGRKMIEFYVIEKSPKWVKISEEGKTHGLARAGFDIARDGSDVWARWSWQKPDIKPLEHRDVWMELTKSEREALRSFTTNSKLKEALA